MYVEKMMAMKNQSWFLATFGVVCGLISAVLWYAHWRYYGPPLNGLDWLLTMVFISYLTSLIALLCWLARLDDRHLVQTGALFLIGSLLLFAIISAVPKYEDKVFALSRQLVGKNITEYDHRYVVNWINWFLLPFLTMLNLAVGLLTVAAFIQGVMRRVTRRA